MNRRRAVGIVRGERALVNYAKTLEEVRVTAAVHCKGRVTLHLSAVVLRAAIVSGERASLCMDKGPTTQQQQPQCASLSIRCCCQNDRKRPHTPT